MTNLDTRVAHLRPHLLIEELLIRHGAWTVLRALATAMLRGRRRRRLEAADLSNHLRRDVGLPPSHPPPALRDLHF
jgi:hypothetical protein